MLISVEHELPARPLDGTQGVLPEVFEGLWEELESEGWKREGQFGVSRMPSCPCPGAKKPEQAFTTDTGPTLELASSPAETISDIEQQTSELREIAKVKLASRKIVLMGSGIHPNLGISREEYFRYRTPRLPYDYANDAVDGRGWQHRAILNIAAMQEIVDVSVTEAPAIVATMHRLAGILIFLLRNDPDYHNVASKRLSMRPHAWKYQVAGGRFPQDIHKVCVPEREVRNWTDYLRLLWEASPMFLLGTKNSGLVYIPEHPTFAEFISSPPKDGWLAKQVNTGEMVRVAPEFDHVTSTDWSYMGFARLRMFWQEDTSLMDLVRIYKSGNDKNMESFLGEHLNKVLLENRSSATPPPGAEMCSLALVVGLVQRMREVQKLVGKYSYEFWLETSKAAELAPFNSQVQGVSISQLAGQILRLAEAGLADRGFGEEQYLEVLKKRVGDNQSHSEKMIALQGSQGLEAVIDSLTY